MGEKGGVAMVEVALNVVFQGSLPSATSWWRRADSAGVSTIGLPDSPALLQDVYVASAACALATSQTRVMTSVTNPVTRDPSVTAAALFALDELAPGRIVLGIGSGDSALWGVGLKPARLAELREYIVAVKRLLRGEIAQFQGRTFRANWAWVQRPIEIPVLVPVSGPRVLAMACEVADGMLLSMGFGPDNVSYVRQLTDQGCDSSGRDPSSLELWWNSEVVFGASVDEARSRSMGISTSWLTMGTLDGKQIPEHLRSALIEFNAGIHDVGTAYQNEDRELQMVRRAKELGLYEWLISRAPGLWGTPTDVARRLTELGDQGMQRWMFYVGRKPSRVLHDLDLYLDGLMPHLAGAVAR
jgi:5,10-methylenetetrahydromethanopterin reductase